MVVKNGDESHWIESLKITDYTNQSKEKITGNPRVCCWNFSEPTKVWDECPPYKHHKETIENSLHNFIKEVKNGCISNRIVTFQI